MHTKLTVWFVTAAVLWPQEWPQFLGPTRNGVYAGTVAAKPWPEVWKKDVGQGFAAPVVAQGHLILFHRVGDKETIDCLEAKTGRRIWSYEYPTAYRDDFGFDEGPRGTPSIAGGRVYSFGAEGKLHCLDFASGKKLWAVDTHRVFGVRKGFFGAACSPLVEGDLVLVNVGGTEGAGLVAFDKNAGKIAWKATSDDASYSSPVAATIGGARAALFFTRGGLVAVEPAGGKVRFQFPWRSRSHASVNAAAPLVLPGDLIFLSASYGTGAVLLAAQGSGVKQAWASDDVLSNHYATSVFHNGYLYGYHGRQEEGPSLRCVEAKSGKVAWSVDRFGAGTITLAGESLLVLREGGELVLAPASPKAFRPAARAQILPATVRSYPALADGCLYARNERTLVCLRLQ